MGIVVASFILLVLGLLGIWLDPITSPLVALRRRTQDARGLQLSRDREGRTHPIDAAARSR